MCGICGFTAGASGELLTEMTKTLVHRGPDAAGYYRSTDMSLGMARLSIVDLDAEQPVRSEDSKVVVIMNGEIYNHEEWRKDLESKGHKFVSDHSDTEIVPHMYEEYGKEWVTKINGMFAIALWDMKKETLLLYRDRIGKKPLYYSIVKDVLVFGSEIKALLKFPNINKELDHYSLYDYFSKKTTIAPRTIYKGIQQVLPGEYLEFKNKKIRTEKYWSPYHIEVSNCSEDSLHEQFIELLKDSVLIRTKCDVPYGAYLSGGVDSSSVVSMLTKYGNSKLKTFCLGYNTINKSEQFDGKREDIEFARRISKQFGTDHYECIIDHKQFVDAVPNILSAFDEPFSGAISTYFVSELMKGKITVALSGDGADELFGSYLIPRLAPLVAYYKKHGGICWDWPKKDLENLLPYTTVADLNMIHGLADTPFRWRNNFNVFSFADLVTLLTFANKESGELFTNFFNQPDHFSLDNPVNSILVEDQLDLLPNQVLPFVDRLSMSHSIEARCPYLDYRIIEFANSLPGDWKIKAGNIKLFQKNALLRYNILPEEVIQRKKEGFVQPIYSWLGSELQDWAKEHLAELPKELINKQYVETLDFTKDMAKIWNLVCFSVWYNRRYKNA